MEKEDHAFQNESVETVTQPENPVNAQKLKTDELPILEKMPLVAVMPIPSKKDADESLPVKVVEIEKKGSQKTSKITRSVVSDLNTLKDVPHSMPIIDVQHDKTKNDKSFASAELL